MEKWNTNKSLLLYDVNEWSSGFFSINKQGNVCVTPEGPHGPSLDLMKLVNDLVDRGMRVPLWIRFPDIVKSRIQALQNCFHTAFDTYNYKGKYKGVYPIKVNQQKHLVEDMVRFGEDYSLGLEAGSKPELLISIAMLDNPNALLICNGFKDKEYIETALHSLSLGRNTIVVIERFDELPLLIQTAKKMKVKARIGFRMKLESKGSGKWVESSGARSKFGLTTNEVVRGIELLKSEGCIEFLELLHFHLGSQITSIRPIKESLREACRVYVEMCSLGADLKYLDVGGGLGVDYDGSKTNSENSLNYSEQEYANDVVSSIQFICDQHNLEHPSIVTEAGRALVAHHSVLIFNVLGANTLLKSDPIKAPKKKDHEMIQEIYDVYSKINMKNLVESYHDALQTKEEAINLFNLGYLSIRERADVEELFWATITKIRKIVLEFKEIPEELESLDKHIQDSYFCNFSVFQSAPDHWAVRQLFPVMPIHRLKEEPTRKAILMDLTCDSDGKMDRFIDIKDVKHSLAVHELKPDEDYYLGTFLLGAYQEILGDLHNLFGDTDSVHVSIRDNDYFIENYVEGNSVTEVLEYVEYFKPALMDRMRFAVEAALKDNRITMQEGRAFMRQYEEGLNGYTYLEEVED